MLVDRENASDAAQLASPYAPSRVDQAVNTWHGEQKEKGGAMPKLLCESGVGG